MNNNTSSLSPGVFHLSPILLSIGFMFLFEFIVVLGPLNLLYYFHGDYLMSIGPFKSEHDFIFSAVWLMTVIFLPVTILHGSKQKKDKTPAEFYRQFTISLKMLGVATILFHTISIIYVLNNL